MEEENDDVETHTPTSPGRDVTSSTPDVVIEAQKESVRFAKPADSYRLESDVNQNVKKVVLRRSLQNRTPGDEVKDNIVACHVTNVSTQPDVTMRSTDSFEMKQSFGPESTFEVLDETDMTSNVSVSSTVKSDSPASLGAIVGVTTAGAWQRDDAETAPQDDVITHDEYGHDSPVHQASVTSSHTPRNQQRADTSATDMNTSLRKALLRGKPSLSFDKVVEFKDDFDVKPAAAAARARNKERPKSGQCRYV